MLFTLPSSASLILEELITKKMFSVNASTFTGLGSSFTTGCGLGSSFLGAGAGAGS